MTSQGCWQLPLSLSIYIYICVCVCVYSTQHFRDESSFFFYELQDESSSKPSLAYRPLPPAGRRRATEQAQVLHNL